MRIMLLQEELRKLREENKKLKEESAAQAAADVKPAKGSVGVKEQRR